MTGLPLEPSVADMKVLLEPSAPGSLRTLLQAALLRARHLLARPASAVSALGLPGEQSFCLARPAAPGWYMLEVCATSGRSLLEGYIELRGDREYPPAQRSRFPLHNRRLCKRLILVQRTQAVCLAFRAQPGDVQVSVFRLMPVTAAFARSRMLRKLAALHPMYRGDPDRAADTLTGLWRHYSALFEARQDLVPYLDWLRAFGHYAAGAQAHPVAPDGAPSFCVIVIAAGADDDRLVVSLDSVRSQIFLPLRVIVVQPGSDVPAAAANAQDERMRMLAYSAAEGLSGGLERAIAAADGDWVQFLHAGDLLAADALSTLAAELANSPECLLAYTDEDVMSRTGKRLDHHFKPDWDIDLVHSQNYVGASAIYRLELVRAAGRFIRENDGAQLFDLLLRCTESIDATEVRHIPRVLLHRPNDRWDDEAASGEYASGAGVRALRRHFARCGTEAGVTLESSGYRVRYPVPETAPLVTLIIPTRNGLALLRRCIESILEKTSYTNFDIIVVDNGSDDPATLRYLEQLATQNIARVLRDDRPFNYSALNNVAVKQARGEIVGLINNDVEVINSDWLSEMVGHVLRPGVGAVGARLWYDDDTLQHAGIILGMEGTAGHIHRFLARGQKGYSGRAVLTQSFSAVTGACLLVRKHNYELVGGLNESDLPVACNDVDFCLRLREHGYRNIWTPYAELYHHESRSRGLDDSPEKAERAKHENAYLRRRWGALIDADPAYNPNLSLGFTDVMLAWPPRVLANRVVSALAGEPSDDNQVLP